MTIILMPSAPCIYCGATAAVCLPHADLVALDTASTHSCTCGGTGCCTFCVLSELEHERDTL